MGLRFRRKPFDALKRTMPPEIKRHIGWSPAPPGFVMVSFGSQEAEDWVIERLGAPLEAVYGVNALEPNAKKPGKWPAKGSK